MQKSSLTTLTAALVLTCFLFAPVWSVMMAKTVNQKVGSELIPVSMFSRLLVILSAVWAVSFSALVVMTREGPSLDAHVGWTFFSAFACGVVLVGVLTVLNTKVFLALEKTERGRTRSHRTLLFAVASVLLIFLAYPYLHLRVERLPATPQRH